MGPITLAVARGYLDIETCSRPLSGYRNREAAPCRRSAFPRERQA
jgi:hypothetical protein